MGCCTLAEAHQLVYGWLFFAPHTGYCFGRWLIWVGQKRKQKRGAVAALGNAVSSKTLPATHATQEEGSPRILFASLGSKHSPPTLPLRQASSGALPASRHNKETLVHLHPDAYSSLLIMLSSTPAPDSSDFIIVGSVDSSVDK